MSESPRTPAAIIEDIVALMPPAEQATAREMLTIVARRGGGIGLGYNASPEVGPLMKELSEALTNDPPILE